MSEFYVVLDALFEPELVAEAKTASNVSESLSEFLAVHEQNLSKLEYGFQRPKVDQGRKTSGSTFVFSCDGMSSESVTKMIERLSSFSDSSVVDNGFICRVLHPLDRSRKLRLRFR